MIHTLDVKTNAMNQQKPKKNRCNFHNNIHLSVENLLMYARALNILELEIHHPLLLRKNACFVVDHARARLYFFMKRID